MSSDINKRVAVIGGGLCGLTAAIRLAESGFQVEIFEAAAKAGGRTRSFVDKTTGELCDNGPHLLIGAYQVTQQLLSDCDASANITWQPSLKLPLWHMQRSHFSLDPSPWLPLSLALLLAIRKLPGHGWASAAAMLRLAIRLRQKSPAGQTVAELIKACAVPSRLVSDMLEPICLGTMNEEMTTADASSFKRVLSESFATQSSARLGWFNRPLDLALIEPLINRAEQLGINIRHRSRVRSVQPQADGLLLDGEHFDVAVLALPAYAADTLLARDGNSESRCITNVHLWYKSHGGFSHPFIGGITTSGQWFFDVSHQMQQEHSGLRHFCAVISADECTLDDLQLVNRINCELNQISNSDYTPCHYRIIREKRATVLVRGHHQDEMPSTKLIDASEAPQPGELPATIEFAVQRGEKAALEVKKLLL